MSLGKWLSAGTLAAATLAAALVRLGPHWLGAEQSLVTAQAALAAACALGATAWLAQAILGRDLSRLTGHVAALGNTPNAPPPSPALRTRRGRALSAVIDGTVGTLRRRLDVLVSQRRELDLQARLAEAQRRHLEAVLNALSDAVVVTDAFNELALANAAAARVLGFDLPAALRQPVERVVEDPHLVKLIKDTREAAPATPSLRRHAEHRLGPDPAAVYDVTLTGVAGASEASSAAGGVVTILHDVTREKQIAAVKSDFVSKVSHELRTPLSSIKAYVELLLDGEAHDEQTRREFYNIIQSETDRLQRLIDNILNISRIESGLAKVQREPVALLQLIRKAIDVLQPQARDKGIDLVEVASPLFFEVLADKDMIYQAILNLISNAIKYTDRGGNVSVSVAVDEHAGTVDVSVRDTGVGIPPAAMPHLFEKFFRVAEHNKMAKGTGLGLNLVKHIVETVHGGSLSVASQPGEGSTFTFRLPMTDRETQV